MRQRSSKKQGRNQCSNRKSKAAKDKILEFFTCKACGQEVTGLVSDPRYPLKQQHLCCEKCAQKFKNRPELKFGQKIRRSKESWYHVTQTAK